MISRLCSVLSIIVEGFAIVVKDCWLTIMLVHHSFLSSLINICVYPWEVYYPIKEQVDSLK